MNGQEITFRSVFIPIWASRKRIALITISVSLLTLGVNFLIPKYYKANAVILPETEKNKLSSLGSLTNLASLAGVSLPSGDISRLYPVILSSETVLTSILERKYLTDRFKDSVDLIQYMKLDEGSPEKNLDKGIRILRDLLVVNYDFKTNVVTASVVMPEPNLAADVMNAALHELDLFLRMQKSTSATEQRKWIESRLVQVNAELRSAEDALKVFREKNRRVSDSPELMLVQERLMREVQVKGAIDVELLKQAEIAKIDEIKQVSTINILDAARPPVRKEGPRKATNAVIAFFLVFVFSSGYFAVRTLYGVKIREYVRSLV